MQVLLTAEALSKLRGRDATALAKVFEGAIRRLLAASPAERAKIESTAAMRDQSLAAADVPLEPDLYQIAYDLAEADKLRPRLLVAGALLAELEAPSSGDEAAFWLARAKAREKIGGEASLAYSKVVELGKWSKDVWRARADAFYREAEKATGEERRKKLDAAFRDYDQALATSGGKDPQALDGKWKVQRALAASPEFARKLMPVPPAIKEKLGARARDPREVSAVMERAYRRAVVATHEERVALVEKISAFAKERPENVDILPGAEDWSQATKSLVELETGGFSVFPLALFFGAMLAEVEAPAARPEAATLPAYWVALGRAHVPFRKVAAVREAFDRAVAIGSDDPSVWVARGKALLDLVPGSPEARTLLKDAFIAFERAHALDSRCVPALVGKGRIRKMAGDVQGARDELARALSIEPTNAAALALKGELG